MIISQSCLCFAHNIGHYYPVFSRINFNPAKRILMLVTWTNESDNLLSIHCTNSLETYTRKIETRNEPPF